MEIRYEKGAGLSMKPTPAMIYEAMSALAEQPEVKPEVKPKRTVTYVCPVCAASLERQE